MNLSGLFLRVFDATLKAAIMWVEEVKAIRDEFGPADGGHDSRLPSTPGRRSPRIPVVDLGSQLPDLLSPSQLPPPPRSILKRAASPDRAESTPKRPRTSATATPGTPDPSSEYHLPLMAAFLYLTGLNGNSIGTWELLLEMAGDYIQLKASGLRTKFRYKLKDLTDAEIKDMASEFKEEHGHVYQLIKGKWAEKQAAKSKPKAKGKSQSSKGSPAIAPQQIKALLQALKATKRHDSDSDSD